MDETRATMLEGLDEQPEKQEAACEAETREEDESDTIKLSRLQVQETSRALTDKAAAQNVPPLLSSEVLDGLDDEQAGPTGRLQPVSMRDRLRLRRQRSFASSIVITDDEEALSEAEWPSADEAESDRVPSHADGYCLTDRLADLQLRGEEITPRARSSSAASTTTNSETPSSMLWTGSAASQSARSMSATTADEETASSPRKTSALEQKSELSAESETSASVASSYRGIQFVRQEPYKHPKDVRPMLEADFCEDEFELPSAGPLRLNRAFGIGKTRSSSELRASSAARNEADRPAGEEGAFNSGEGKPNVTGLADSDMMQGLLLPSSGQLSTAHLKKKNLPFRVPPAPKHPAGRGGRPTRKGASDSTLLAKMTGEMMTYQSSTAASRAREEDLAASSRRKSNSGTGTKATGTLITRPTSRTVFGDGTELNAIPDLATKRAERRTASDSASSGCGNPSGSPTSIRPPQLLPAIPRRSTPNVPAKPQPALIRNLGAIDPSTSSAIWRATAASAARAAAITSSQRERISSASPIPSSTQTGPPTGRRHKQLLSNTSEMRWNERKRKWDGNEEARKLFEQVRTSNAKSEKEKKGKGGSRRSGAHGSASGKPPVVGLIRRIDTPSSPAASKPTGIGRRAGIVDVSIPTASPVASPTSSGSAVKIVGEMMFDPVSMRWLHTRGSAEEDFPFEEFEGGDRKEAEDAEQGMKFVSVFGERFELIQLAMKNEQERAPPVDGSEICEEVWRASMQAEQRMSLLRRTYGI